MAVPRQSEALAAVLEAPPRITGKATLRDVAVAEEYEENVKRRRVDTVSELANASCEDSAAAKVRILLARLFDTISWLNGLMFIFQTQVYGLEVALKHSETMGSIIEDHQKPLLDKSLESLNASVKVHADTLVSKFDELKDDTNRQFSDLKSSLRVQFAPFLRQVQEGMNARNLVSQRPLRLFCKTVPGHHEEFEEPTDPAFQGLERPVPIGALPPPCTFCPNGTISRASLTTLTAAHLAHFAWFYNERFSGKFAWHALP
jgi:hypothetical protein